eukprot:TRINITY_DN42756_c0_g1_i1.p1 TRINITY_DN42756_c0_g1~~TRINITY_DN42756_c0_g1_i1.p1  ORF type:complete len:482 (-),score=59.89 TRINITY_DN42756_c0_g1_i1:11-1456(-)
MSSGSDSASGDDLLLSETDDEDERLHFAKVRSLNDGVGSEPLVGSKRPTRRPERYTTEPPPMATDDTTLRASTRADIQSGMAIYRRQAWSSSAQTQTIPMMKPAELAQSLASDEAVVVDVRDYDYFYLGHIPGSRHVPSDSFQEQLPSLVYEFGRKMKKIVFCCTASSFRDDICSSKFKRAVHATCFTRETCLVYRLEGGMTAWSKFCESKGLEDGMLQASPSELMECLQKTEPQFSPKPRKTLKSVTFSVSDKSLPEATHHAGTASSPSIKTPSLEPPAFRRRVHGKLGKSSSVRFGQPNFKPMSMCALPSLQQGEAEASMPAPRLAKMQVPEKSQSMGVLPSMQVQSEVRPISPADLSELLQAGNVHVVDVRDLDFYVGHIPDAIHTPDGAFEDQLPRLVRDLGESDKSVIFHCMNCEIRGPRCADMFLRSASHTFPDTHCSIFYLKGGFQAWQKFCFSFGIQHGIVRPSVFETLGQIS